MKTTNFISRTTFIVLIVLTMSVSSVPTKSSGSGSGSSGSSGSGSSYFSDSYTYAYGNGYATDTWGYSSYWGAFSYTSYINSGSGSSNGSNGTGCSGFCSPTPPPPPPPKPVPPPAPTCDSSNVCTCPISYTYTGGICEVTGCPSGFMCDIQKCLVKESGKQKCTCPTSYTLQGTICTAFIPVDPEDPGCKSKGPVCSGNNIVNSCTGELMNNPSSCNLPDSAGCSAGRCLPPPPANIVTWSVRPALVQSGKTTSVSWQANYVNSCTVRGTNGDGPWSGASSTHISSPIIGQTIYTLSCVGFDAATTSRNGTVNIAPKFQEQ